MIAIDRQSTPADADLLARQANRESNARTYPRGLPIAIGHATGVEVYSVDGKRYLDCFAGAGVLALGHNHPVVVQAVREQLGQLVHALDFPTPVRDDITTELLDTLPPSLSGKMKVHWCAPTGSDAVEAALKLCKRFTGRGGVVAFMGGYHGMTAGAVSVTSLWSPRELIPNLMPGVSFAPYAYCSRCPLKLTRNACETACASLVETMLTDTHSGIGRPAAMLMEMVQGEGGGIIPTRAFVYRVRELSQQEEIPFIADEIQMGFGRTGRFWAFEHFDIEPDVIVTSKALGGIGLPIAAILYRRELDVWEPGTHIGTFRGHQLAMAAGAAALRVFREDGILENVRLRGHEFVEGLRNVRSPHVFDIRGIGLSLAVEFATPESGAPDTRFAQAVRTECFSRGLLCELGGRGSATLRILPPLVISAQQVREAVGIIQDAVIATERCWR
ncbi:MAG: diaminobutyrate--2-oxoglutarate transaminase family protein [Polyangiaceae bacterium]